MTEIETMRRHLKSAARKQPEQAPVYDKLSKQLRNFEGGDEEAKAALRPMIRDSLKKIAGCGR